VGEAVNLEHAATPSTLLGGHLVQGHVDGVGRVARVRRGDDWRVWIALPRGDDPRHVSGADLAACVVPKGSICVDGVSLTVAGVWAGSPGAAEAERRGGRGLTRMGTDRGTKGDGGAGERGFEVALIPTTLELTTLAGLSVGDPVNLEVDVIAKTVVGWMRLFGGAGAKAKSEKRKAKINPGPR
jgi:riboflavin synthase